MLPRFSFCYRHVKLKPTFNPVQCLLIFIFLVDKGESAGSWRAPHTAKRYSRAIQRFLIKSEAAGAVRYVQAAQYEPRPTGCMRVCVAYGAIVPLPDTAAEFEGGGVGCGAFPCPSAA